MWTRKHGLKGQSLKTLETLVKFCIDFYFKMFYEIKVKALIVDAPHHILTCLRILRAQPKKVRDCITFYVRTGAWYAHSECLLVSLLASLDPKEREFAVNKILELRGEAEYGDNSPRARVTPKINLDATSLTDLIDWKEGEVLEPSLTCSRSSSEIKAFIATPYVPPAIPSHTQSCERWQDQLNQYFSHFCTLTGRSS